MGEFQIQDKSLNLGSTISYTRARDFGQSFNLSKGQLFHLGLCSQNDLHRLLELSKKIYAKRHILVKEHTLNVNHYYTWCHYYTSASFTT